MFVAAVQTDLQGRLRLMRLTPIAGFTNQTLRHWATGSLAPTAHGVSDGLWAFAQVMQMGATHERNVSGAGRQGVQKPQLRWVNTMLSNLKTLLAGTYHSFDHAKYGARYLAEFAYRFNRRFDLPAMLPRLLRAAVTTHPLPLRVLSLSEAGS